MRIRLCNALIERSKNVEFVFLTGDLGFNTFEPLSDCLGERFVNAGVAEQNMISVAAGIASEDLEVWVYSIAPFIYARAFEQIRNDIIFHKLPVNLIGNGGGFGYGVMGPSHHAIDDYGVLGNLQDLDIYLPTCDNDINEVVNLAGDSNHPTYLRLGISEFETELDLPNFQQWRQLTFGNGPPVVVIGPLAGTYLSEFEKIDQQFRPNLWVISRLPLTLDEIPLQLISNIKLTKMIILCEEHIKHSGISSLIYQLINEKGLSNINFIHKFVPNYSLDLYGSQNYLRAKYAIDALSILNEFKHK